MKKRWLEIDVLYAIGTILVILGHSHSSDWSAFSGTILNSVIPFIYTFHMPLFFFVAGFLFWNSTALEKVGYGKWIKNKTEKLLTPYVVLSLLVLVPKYYIENRGFGGFTTDYLLEVAFVPRTGVWGHFWFLPTLFSIYVVFGLLKKLSVGNHSCTFLAVTSVISLVLYFLPFKTNWFGFNDFKESVFFFVLGMIFNQTAKDKPSKSYIPYRIAWILIGTIFSVIISEHFNQIKVMMLVTAVIMISVCWQIAVLSGGNKISAWISKNNYTIYIYSWPFQSVIMVITEKLNFPWYLTTLSMFVVGFTIPILMILIYKKLKKLNNRFFDLLLGVK